MRTARKLKTKIAAAIEPIPLMTVSEWANNYMYLPSTSAEPGRYRTDRTPYVTEIMDAFSQNEIHKVAVKSSAQIGKSTILLAVIGRFAHLNPCTMMIVQPSLEMAQDFSKDRLNRMIQDCPALTPLFADLEKTRNANQTILSKFFTGGRVVLQGANSPAGLASRPIKILLCDEVDRFPQSAGAEGDPISLAAKRTTTFWDYKIGLFSTPTVENVSRIDVEYNLGTQEQWQHCCRNCGEYHFLNYRDMLIDFTEHFDANKIRTVIVNSVKYKCPDCGFEFSQLEMAACKQKYIAQNPDALKNGVRSFWVNGFSSPWLSWEKIMTEWLEAKGDALREQTVYNTRFGLSYELKGEFQDENEFLRRREEYNAEIPAGVLILTAGVDVQINRLEYAIFGWGIGEECFAITHGIIRGSPNDPETWQGLLLVLCRDFHFSDGRALKVARTFVDSGFSTSNVYEFCRANQARQIYPIKGKGGAGLSLIHQYTYPKQTGIILTILGVNTGKAEVFSRLAVQSPGVNYIHFPHDDDFCKRGFDSEYFRQLIAEKRVLRKIGGVVYTVFENLHDKRNESLDCLVYALASLKSCIGNNPDDFWRRQADVVNSKSAPVKKSRTVVTRSVDLWSNAT